MNNTKNIYKELLPNGKIIDQEGTVENYEELHSAFEFLPGYEKIDKNTIKINVNGKQKIASIFKIVCEGKNRDMASSENERDRLENVKRVRVQKSQIKFMPDIIMTAYINQGLVIYGFSDNIESLLDLPESGNLTTLYRVDVRFLKNALSKKTIKTNILSRGIRTKVLFSTNVELLLNGSKSDVNNVDDNLFLFPDDYVFEPLDDDLYDELEDEDNDETIHDEAGLVGEKIVSKLIKEESSLLESIEDIRLFEWVNENGEKFLPMDFYDKNNKRIIEVKSSYQENNNTFFMSSKERQKMVESPSRYFLIKVNGVNEDDMSFSSVKVYTGDQLMKMYFDTIEKYLYKEKNDN